MTALPLTPGLEAWGWDVRWAAAFAALAAEGVEPARVVTGQRLLGLRTATGDILAEVSGSLRHAAESPEQMPAVGDWVAVAVRAGEGRGTIHGVLSRRSRFVRRAAGDETLPQVVAANVDTVFLVSSLDKDLNLRRLERYLAVARDSGAEPVILLNKEDLPADPDALTREVQAIAAAVPVVRISAKHSLGLAQLERWLLPGRTVALLGSSGVGKSTLVNRLLGEERQRTLEVRAHDDRGRHATTHRELLLLPTGAMVIDTPGMREMHLWEASAGLQETFTEITGLGQECRFRDCGHRQEPGCAVRAAIEAGVLDADRLDSFHHLEDEQSRVGSDLQARLSQKSRVKAIHRAARKHQPRE